MRGIHLFAEEPVESWSTLGIPFVVLGVVAVACLVWANTCQMRMRDSRRWRITYGTLGYSQVFLGLLASAIAASLKADAADWGRKLPGSQVFISWLQSNAWWLVVVLTVLIGVCGIVKSLIGSPKLWPTLHKVLDEIREEVFADAANDPLHDHRVTLFKHVGWGWRWRCWRWPWSGWLVPVVRSGHLTQSSPTVFRAPDDAKLAEGIAGKAWTGQTLWIPELPDVGRKASPTDEDFRAFARATGVSERWVRKKRPDRRAYGGFIIEVQSKPWGVVVLDSTSPQGLKEKKGRTREQFARIVGCILEGAQR